MNDKQGIEFHSRQKTGDDKIHIKVEAREMKANIKVNFNEMANSFTLTNEIDKTFGRIWTKNFSRFVVKTKQTLNTLELSVK